MTDTLQLDWTDSIWFRDGRFMLLFASFVLFV